MSRLTRGASTSISMLVLFLTCLNQRSDGQIHPSNQDRQLLLLVQNGSVGLRGGMAFRVTRVRPESPAARAGLRSNDLIFSVDEIPVNSREQLDRTLLQPMLNPGSSFLITFGRFDPATGRLEVIKQQVRAD